MTLRRHTPNPEDPRKRRRILSGLSVLLFVFEVVGAMAFAVGLTSIVGTHAGFYPAVTVAGLFTFGYAYTGQVIVKELIDV